MAANPSALAGIDLKLPNVTEGELAGQVYTELREAICDGRIEANQRLVQNALAEELDISRTPVRDALLHLSQEGLVRPAPTRGGFIVTEFTPHEVLEIYDVRLALEPMAAAQSAGHHSRTQLAEMKDVNAEILEHPELPLREQYLLNQRFHELVVAECGNRILIRMLIQLWSMPSSWRMYHQQFEADDSHEIVYRGHASIVEALEDGDALLAEQRVRDHVAAAKQTTLDHFQAQGG
ncbi:MAG: GntR family transcriptional regulator [Solirubrobacterales bacterium]|nr:GntR family transcriptional regulator [Solirubrobacterales bacterium]